MLPSPQALGETLLDSIQDGMVAAAEIGANRVLALDETALAACADLQGHCVAVDITDLDFQVYCHPGNWGLRLSRNAPASDVDATISGRLMALVNLAAQQDKLSTSIRERVSFHGDVALAQRMQAILTDLDIDWEEALAAHGGDLFAFQAGQGARKLGAFLQQSADSLLQTSSEYLREEARLAPTQAEFDRFQSAATRLKQDVARAEARLQQILDRVERR